MSSRWSTGATVLIKATPFTEDADGYAKLFGVLGAPTDALVGMEVTGHYWKNLFAALVAAGFAQRLRPPTWEVRCTARRGDCWQLIRSAEKTAWPCY